MTIPTQCASCGGPCGKGPCKYGKQKETKMQIKSDLENHYLKHSNFIDVLCAIWSDKFKSNNVKIAFVTGATIACLDYKVIAELLFLQEILIEKENPS